MKIELRKIVLILTILLLLPYQAFAAVTITTTQPSMAGTQYNYRHSFDMAGIPAGEVLEFVVYTKSSSTGNLVATSNKKIYNGGSSGSSFFQWSKAAGVERWVIAYQAEATLSTNDRRQHKVWTCHIKTDQSFDCGSGVVTPPDPVGGGSTSLNVTAAPAGNGNVNLSWSPVDGAVGYQVLQDGQVVENLTPNTSVTLPDYGEVRVIAFDQHSQVITSELIQLGDSFPPDPGTEPDPWEECATAICNCIKELQPALDQIEQNTGGMLGQLGQLLTKTDEVKAAINDFKQTFITEANAIKQEIRSLHNEFVPTQQHNLPSPDSVTVPNLEDNKPPMRNGVYTDTTTYFTDQGDAAAPPAFPAAPEPTTSWDDGQGGSVSREQPLVKEPVRSRDEVLQRDEVKERDQPLQRDPVPQKDTTDYKQQLRWRSDQYRP